LAKTSRTQAITQIRGEYERSVSPWFLGYSGGKDSTVLLTLVMEALCGVATPTVPVTVVYCDTGVEIPPIRAITLRTLSRIKVLATAAQVPLRIAIARPRLDDRFFVKIIGRGYAPPSNRFRWCTDRLRVDPLRAVVRSNQAQRHIVVVGLRKGESQERDRKLLAFAGSRPNFLTNEGHKEAPIFAPLLNFSNEDIWTTLLSSYAALDGHGQKIAALYRDATGSRNTKIADLSHETRLPRFGCWACTVVRRDKAVEGLVRAGHEDLRPLLLFRDWLQSIRNDPSCRCSCRRNGQDSPGPFNLKARRTILKRLLEAQHRSGHKLIQPDELRRIAKLWQADEKDMGYMRLEQLQK